jgi:hypothetical protein
LKLLEQEHVQRDALAGFREALGTSELLQALFNFSLDEVSRELRKKLLLDLLADLVLTRLATGAGSLLGLSVDQSGQHGN